MSLKLKYNPNDCKLFTDSAKIKLFCYTKQKFLTSVPVGHTVHVNVTYVSVKMHLQAIRYEDHQWKIHGNLKVIAVLLGTTLWYTKYFL